ncbi:cardiolipin synthase [Kocuria sp. WRN011]|uniref:Cardiolipin synthase n=1 Tax=Kocuria carniphila TaxID=262208 RepID=A0ABV3V0W4_9MICC|nr:cardiolipin synthase [Kocuria sp. WRN011]PBB09581.1 cardiolipin synthase [Kocuria sp. WRN011]
MFPWTPYELFSPDTVPEWILVILGVIDLLVRIVALGWIPHNRRPSVALAWLLAIFLLPYAGLLLFLVVGSSRLPRKRMEKQAKMNDIIRENTPEDFALGEEFHHLPEWVTTTAKLNYQLGALPMVGGNGFDILTDNHDSMAQMARDVDRATDYVHFEFYIVATDRVSQVLLDSLVRAHERGVRVRILIDHVGSLGYPGYAELVRRFNASGIPWRRMLPIRPWRGEWQRPDLRNHRKILVVDGSIAYTGSQNIIHRSYNKKKNVRRGLEWKDLMIRCSGPVVAELNAVFVSDWYSETDDLLLDEATEVLTDVEGPVYAQVVPSGPGFETENNLRLFNHLIYNANRRVVISSPYFVPDESLLHALTTEAQSGVDVEIFVGESSDHFLAQNAQNSYYSELAEAGVKIHRYSSPTVLHAKFVLVDDLISVIGSSNMDERSFALDLEVSVMIVDQGFHDRMEEVVEEFKASSTLLDLDLWNKRPMRQKYVENVCRLTSALL